MNVLKAAEKHTSLVIYYHDSVSLIKILTDSFNKDINLPEDEVGLNISVGRKRFAIAYDEGEKTYIYSLETLELIESINTGKVLSTYFDNDDNLLCVVNNSVIDPKKKIIKSQFKGRLLYADLNGILSFNRGSILLNDNKLCETLKKTEITHAVICANIALISEFRGGVNIVSIRENNLQYLHNPNGMHSIFSYFFEGYYYVIWFDLNSGEDLMLIVYNDKLKKVGSVGLTTFSEYIFSDKNKGIIDFFEEKLYSFKDGKIFVKDFEFEA